MCSLTENIGKKLAKAFGFLSTVWLMGVLSCVEEEGTDPVNDETIVEIVNGRTSLSTLSEAILLSGLEATFSAPGAFTFLAPTDQAFINAGIHEVSAVNKDELRNFILYHVIEGRVASSELSSGSMETLLPDAAIHFSVEGEHIRINGTSNVVDVDIDASNGVIHTVDAVLTPYPEE